MSGTFLFVWIAFAHGSAIFDVHNAVRSTPSMMIERYSLALLFVFSLVHTHGQVPIGEWRDHFTYRNAISVTEGGGKAYAATTAAIFSLDLASGEIQRITKANLLSDVGISRIRWNSTLGALVIAYDNGNLDVIRGDQRYNINDIKESNIVGSKGIIHMTFQGAIAYLSCGFGVVVVDLDAREVRETWLIGPGGTNLRMYGVAFLGDSVYVASDEGLYSAWRNNVNLGAFTSWRKRLDLNHPNGPFTGVAAFGNKLLVNYTPANNPTDTLYFTDGGPWQVMVGVSGRRNFTMEVSQNGNTIVITHGGDAREFDQSLTELRSAYGIQNAATFQVTQGVVTPTGELLFSDSKFGLVRTNGGDQGVSVLPNGPNHPDAIKIDAAGGSVYVATGALAGNWTNFYDKFGVYYFIDGVWGFVDQSNSTLMDGVNDYGGAAVDIMAVRVDPLEPRRAFAGSWDEGILEYFDHQLVTIHNATNSSLHPELAFLPTEKINVAGLDFDEAGNLWASNANVDEVIAVRTASGAWYSYTPGSTLLNGNTLVGDILAASNGYKWIIRPRGNGLLVFNDNGTISNKTDDEFKVLNTFEGQGGLPDMNVISIAEDPDGEIWVGTAKGVAVFYNPEGMFNGGDFDSQQILIEQDGNVQILLETEEVTAIEIDGAGRKWIGTQTSGAFLISENGTEQIHHFTLENSPLPSNTVLDIGIDGVTGEVFFVTENGIIAYRGDATEGLLKSDCAKVFPNPVQSTYTGPIAIDGLAADSNVKITDISGNLVYTTTSLGGRAIWPGTDLNGERVSTGVYLAMATDRFGEQTCMTKVLVVR